MTCYVLDTSAVVSFFQDASGADVVRDLLHGAAEAKHELLFSVIHWGELYYTVWRKRGEPIASETLRKVAQLPIVLVDIDATVAKLAARFKAEHQLPYVDSFAAALARLRDATLVTGDRDFAKVEKTVRVLWVGV